MAKRLHDMAYEWDLSRVLEYEEEQLHTQRYRSDLDFVLPRIYENKIGSILEFGCGPGFLAAELPLLPYTGIDLNMHMIDRARWRNAPLGRMARKFICFDVRNFADYRADLVIAMHFLNCFGLGEFDLIVQKILSFGKHAALHVLLADEDLDDGQVNHYTAVTPERFSAAVANAGHQLMGCQTAGIRKTREGGASVQDAYWWTQRVSVPQAEPAQEKPVPQPVLLLDGKRPDDPKRFWLAWEGPAGKEKAVLYAEGRRVTGPWQIALE